MNRYGFHYIPDTRSYRQNDLGTWLPELRALGASWVTLMAPRDRAIPESFLRGLIEAGIEPILHFHLLPDDLPNSDDLRLLLNSYARWGVRFVSLFDRPNIRINWKATTWAQSDLVERFLDIYLPLAEIQLRAGLRPIFPPLEPGGDYWDTAFLRGALEGIMRRGHKTLIDELVLGAYAWKGSRHLNWGAGGPERWPSVRPYFTPQDEEDQRGFRIFDWYIAICKAVLLESLPIFLLGMGCCDKVISGFEGSKNDEEIDPDINLTIVRLLAGEMIDELDPIPTEVLGGTFWVLSGTKNTPDFHDAWYREGGKTISSVASLRQWVVNHFKNDSKSKTRSHPIPHYLLLPTYAWGVADWHLDVIKPYVKKYRPAIGFSLSEASLAKRVTVVGGKQAFPDAALNELRTAGCMVRRIDGDGNKIASQLGKI